jgi:hypothetical protein
MIKNPEFQHGGDSVTWPGNPASLSNMIDWLKQLAGGLECERLC